MLDQNTDRSGWAMLALGVLAIALPLVTLGATEIGDLVINSIKGLFVG